MKRISWDSDSLASRQKKGQMEQEKHLAGNTTKFGFNREEGA
jgi:hypothetical protein